MSAVNSDVLRAIATLNEAAFSISLILSGYLLGIVTIQVYIYYTTFPDDPKFLKCAVRFIFIRTLLNDSITLVHSGRFNLVVFNQFFVTAFNSSAVFAFFSVSLT